ncbi:hypothetical protein FACHB389_19495 [Nostoc calcicola FACHB-389]|nr:LysM peptidoglycan-binding domain-containing protein [Nostoc calcicola FACHB-3891]OKH32600.1 hypothetical protein FACHB389_19495 [Nostoc calcicola FACHB-389]
MGVTHGEGSNSFKKYTVQEGDTLYKIAQQYGMTVHELQNANSGLIKDPDNIVVGWVLNIP